MSCETPQLYKAAFMGITGKGDMALWKKPHYGEHAIPVLLSLYGSENQLRGIFSALATNNEVTLSVGEHRHGLSRGFEGHLRFKSWKIGYGKYHALIWNRELVSSCIIVFDPRGEAKAWEQFLQKKRIPFLSEWIPRIAGILERDGLVEALEGFNLKGWHWTASDDEVCEYIVKDIYKTNP